MKLVKLTMVAGQSVTPNPDHTGEDDEVQDNVVTEITKPVVLDAEQIRNFYPRKGDRVGTRILFRNGSALAVTDLFDDVEAAIRSAVA